MPTNIEGQDFTGFFGAGFDADKLRALSHAGRVQWLRFRFDLVLLSPFKGLMALDSGNCYVWLCAMNLLCGAVEALASFEAAGDPMNRFLHFVEKYFRSDWKQRLELHDLRPYRPASAPADHLYKYFRSGLEHSLGAAVFLCCSIAAIVAISDKAPRKRTKSGSLTKTQGQSSAVAMLLSQIFWPSNLGKTRRSRRPTRYC
jgi:hypothetical protein